MVFADYSALTRVFGRFYCSKRCQAADWLNHKQYHENMSRKTGSVDRLGKEFESIVLHKEPSHVEDRDSNGMTALLLKSSSGDWKTVEKLLIAGADSSAADSQGLTALHYASFYGHVRVARILVDNGPKGLVHQTTPDGGTCLSIAALNGNLEMVALVAEAGGDALLLKASANGSSCLHAASQNGHLEVVRYLTEAGGEALLLKTRADGGSCLHSACELGHLDVVRHLVDAGGEALLLKTRADGFTCLQAAAHHGHLPVVEHLVRLLGGHLLAVRTLPGGAPDAAAAAAASGRAAICEAIRDV
jgi:ankyrin repeat protein